MRLARLLRAAIWCSTRSRTFTVLELQEELGLTRRSIYRYINTLEAEGIIELAGVEGTGFGHNRQFYRPLWRMERRA